MKAALISVRIADFLKEYPPFSFIPKEVLVDLASQGKVKFHEEGEIIFSKGQPREKWLFVIQRGKVSVLDESGEEEELIDYRGEGDLLGLQGVISDEPYLHTTKTNSEVILYCLPRQAFVEAAENAPGARRYLAAYFSLSPAYLQEEAGSIDSPGSVDGSITLRKGGLFEVEPPQTVAEENLEIVREDRPVGEVAKKLRSKRINCVLIVDENGLPQGKLTDADLRDAIVEGGVQFDQPVKDVMQRDLVIAHPSENTGQLLLKLTQSGKHFLVVTKDGTWNSEVLGLVSERNLFLHYGRFPSVIGEAISSAPDVYQLKLLRDRMEMLIIEFIEDRLALPWLMEMTGILNRKMTKRIIELAQVDLEDEGLGQAPVDFSWLMMGSGGRDELLIRSAVYHALVYEDPESEEAPHAKRYFKKLAERAGESLRKCGFMESAQGVLAQNEGWCLSLSEMKHKFRRFIEDPVGSHVYHARDAFDFQPLKKDCSLAAALNEEIREAISQNPDFITAMARDSLLNQPPRTIFRGYVVDKAGIEKEDLEIKFHALLPLVDVGRVLSLAAGNTYSSATYKRFVSAAEAVEQEEDKNLLREASNAFRVAQFSRISQGLKTGTDGTVIRPADLDAETRALLVTAFRTILSTLEYTAKRFGLRLRK